MTPDEVKNRNVLVMGLGRFGGGLGVTRWLCRQGANVTVTDLADRTTLADSIDQLADCPVTYRLGEHNQGDLDKADLVVVSPAVDRRKSYFFARIVERRIPWTTEINLFLQLCRARVIGVTGTAGKSTTCALLYEVLRSSMPPGRRAWFGGNVGKSLLTDLDRIGPDDAVILELSSFQLETLPLVKRSPAIAVITNLWPNHLDRHGDFESYASAKMNLFRYQQPGDKAVVGSPGQTLHHAVRQITATTGADLVNVPEPVEPYELRLPGRHNQQNAVCANVVARLTGIDDDVCRAHMAEFAGLPHRLQHVATINGVDYYNDSKSTTPAGTVAALAAFDRPVVAIVGGQDRGDELAPLLDALLSGARAAVCLGAGGSRLADALQGARGDRPSPLIETAGDLAQAVSRAADLAQPGGVILLSPGAPSYGQFVNYEQRGEAFIGLIQAADNRQ
jgi:UDP-N-acetylmuramoylalanine--D-glutamate ligase